MTNRTATHLALAAFTFVPAAAEAQRAAPGSCPLGDGTEMVVGLEGIVIDDESELPLPGATVVLSYEEVEGEPTPENVVTRTDGDGRFRLCRLEPFRTANLRATYLLRRSDEEEVDLERPEVVEIEIDLGDAAYLVFSVFSAETGEPVEGATVDLAPIPVGGITNELGRVGFRAIPPGDYEMTVRHLAYATRTDSIEVGQDQMSELRVDLQSQAIAVAPIEVRITGRDPYLLQSGFYERRQVLGEDGYFGTKPEIESYITLGTLMQYKRELFVRFNRNQFVLINGRPARRLGYTSRRQLNEIPFHRVRGIEAYACSDAPPDLQRWIDAEIVLGGDCNLIAIWTR